MTMSSPTYPEIGATLEIGAPPPGYRHLRYRTCLGTGAEVFEAAAESVLTWRMHRAVGVGVVADSGSGSGPDSASAPGPTPVPDRAEPGVRVSIRLGRGRLAVNAPCLVVGAVESATRRGFAYGTLPGHPECGEEAFLVELMPDSEVWFSVTAFSRPARWYTRSAAGLVPVFQHLYVRRCGRVLRALATATAAVPTASDAARRTTGP